jgi:hypothetical protein
VHDAALGPGRILVDELGQAVQGVEQDVGMHLALQEARLGHQSLVAGGFPFILRTGMGRHQPPDEHHSGPHEGSIEHDDPPEAERGPGAAEDERIDEDKQDGRRFTGHQGKNKALEEVEKSGPSPPEDPG